MRHLFIFILSFWPGLFPKQPTALNTLAEKCAAVAALEGKPVLTRDRSGRVKAVLHRLNITGDTLLLPLEIQNSSPISFEVDFIRFYLRDRKTARRTVMQEVEISPLYTHGLRAEAIPAFGRQQLVFALGKFSFSSRKALVVEVYEKNGGRHLTLFLRPGDMERALPLRF